MNRKALIPAGGNAIVAGLILHSTALLLAMMPAAGADLLFVLLYPCSWIALVFGAFRELRGRGLAPVRLRRFYLIAGAAIVPFFGPLIALGVLRSVRGGAGQGNAGAPLSGAAGGFRANIVVVIIVIAMLLLIFAVLVTTDPYFKRIPERRERSAPRESREYPEGSRSIRAGHDQPIGWAWSACPTSS